MTVAEVRAPTGTWEADPIHSSIGFEIKHMMVSTFRSKFDDYEASLSYAEGEPKLVGTVQVASIEAKDGTLKNHLQSPDFFDVERTPEINFESTAFQREGDELTVDGDLTIRGVTHPVQAHGTIYGPHENIAARRASASSSRRRWTAPTTASGGTPHWPRAASRCRTTSSSRSRSSWSGSSVGAAA